MYWAGAASNKGNIEDRLIPNEIALKAQVKIPKFEYINTNAIIVEIQSEWLKRKSFSKGLRLIKGEMNRENVKEIQYNELNLAASYLLLIFYKTI